MRMMKRTKRRREGEEMECGAREECGTRMREEEEVEDEEDEEEYGG